ncbi:hypothetical protein C8034_v008703 [Colletotrichum sidae]|uniref:Uncharacterized protein n=1 Tax=Colletotrichum sidae TaxID=1347389 RepID=A0A4R8T2T4_9PEZI|nr:hypothetical protein C8034_v008703 [Colletotrichum sidae]
MGGSIPTAEDLHPCEWRSASLNHYVREQDTREKLVMRQVKSVPGHINYYLIFSVKLHHPSSGFDPETRMRQAWAMLRCAQPSVGVVTAGTKVHFTAVDRDGLGVWIADTFFIHPSAESAASLSATIKPNRAMQLHYLPRSKEIILCSSHERVDGLGMIMLLDKICHYFAFPSAPRLAGQADRLSPPLDIAADVGTASPRVWDKARTMLQAWQVNAARSLHIIADRPGPASSTVDTVRLELSTLESASLVSLSKASKVSVNDLMNGLVVMAAKEYAGVTECNWLGGVISNARKLCKHPYNTAEHACNVCFAAIPAYIEHVESALDFARRIKLQRVAFQKDPEALQLLLPMLAMTGDPTDKVQQSQPRANSRCLVEYSGLGSVDELLRHTHGEVQVEDFWVTVGHCGSSIGVYGYFYRKRLNFTLSYNNGFHSRERMSRLLDTLKNVVKDCGGCRVLALL